MAGNSSKSVPEILKTPNNVFDVSTAFLKKHIFGNKNRLGRGSKNLFVWLGGGGLKIYCSPRGGGQVHTDLVKNDASIKPKSRGSFPSNCIVSPVPRQCTYTVS